MSMPEKTSECPFCPDGHQEPTKYNWAVYPDWEHLDKDGQPINLIVAKVDGQHVAESDAEWLRDLIFNAPRPSISHEDKQ